MIFYSIRLAFFVIGMFVLLILAQNSVTTMYFFCNRYYSSEINGEDLEDWEHFGEDQDEADCRSTLITIGWVVYVPVIAFQVHCLYVLNNYMTYDAGVEIQKIVYPDDEDV